MPHQVRCVSVINPAASTGKAMQSVYVGRWTGSDENPREFRPIRLTSTSQDIYQPELKMTLTRTIDYAVNTYQICLGQTKIDLLGSRDSDDFRNGAGFFVELGVSDKPGFSNRFRDHWKQVVKFTLYFVPDDELSFSNRGRVSREWNDNGRILGEAYARFHYSAFGAMQDWLRSGPDITLSLIGEDHDSDSARCRLEGNVVSL